MTSMRNLSCGGSPPSFRCSSIRNWERVFLFIKCSLFVIQLITFCIWLNDDHKLTIVAQNNGEKPMNNLQQNIEEWSQNSYFDEVDRKIIIGLKNDLSKKQELLERFYKDIEFGTGGLRSFYGLGTNRINKYTIRKATQAMAICLNKHVIGPKKVCISFDNRHFSQEFAKEAASVFAANGIQAFLFNQLSPVPLLSYAIRHMKANAGVMITASHNPKEYNGYKAFWEGGAQVVPPYDKEIIDTYNSLYDWGTIKAIPFDQALRNELIQEIPEEVISAYFQKMVENSKNIEMCRNYGKDLNVAFSPIHGTSSWPAKRMAKELGFTNFNVVNEQDNTDPDFSTVISPNPENPSALAKTVDLMKSQKSDIGIACDPDGDRIGVVILNKGTPYYPSGNELAALILDYILGALKENKKMPSSPLAVKSIVTSELLTEICKNFEVKIENTLTGFKWMADKIKEYETRQEKFNFIFAAEESFGYLPHGHCRDKDGISALAMMMELTLYHKKNGRDLIMALNEIYKKYGFFKESLLSLDFVGIEGLEKIQKIMSTFRKNPSLISFSDDPIIQIEDYSDRRVSNLLEGTSFETHTPISNVIGYTFKSGTKLYLRPSGTEPKVKFYTMVKENHGNLEEMKSKARIKINLIETEIKSLISAIK